MSLIRQGVCKLVLTHFRSYAHLTLNCTTQPVILTGPNGVGKTNILEALSFLSPGRGCRQAKLGDIQHIPATDQEPWAVFASLQSQHTDYTVGTSGTKSPSGRDTRRVYLNGQDHLPQASLTDIVNVLWLTPAMDRLFLEGASTRRKFFDRLVYSFDAQHAARLNRFDTRMRERNKLLFENTGHHSWLSVLEKQMAEDTLSILLARKRTLMFIQDMCDQGLECFPSPKLDLHGDLEDLLLDESVLFVENYRNLLEKNRLSDQKASRTLCGPHVTDFSVIYSEKNMSALHCSTGEQKALLIAIILAAARLKSKDQDTITLILLDEIIAHLDENRRHILLNEILNLPLQAWMTGTDASFFKAFKDHMQHFHISDNTLTPY